MAYKRCPVHGRVKTRADRCRKIVRRFGRDEFCWEWLKPVEVKPKPALTPQARSAARARYAAGQVRATHQTIIELCARLGRLSKILKQWRVREERALQRAAMTDEALAAERSKKARKPRPKRGIARKEDEV